jgi:diguanylate cyclase (GGDEF)-like protein
LSSTLSAQIQNTDDYSIQKRIDMDLLHRSIPGVLLYLVLWPLLFFPHNFHLVAPFFSWAFAAVMALVSILRLLHKYYSDQLYDKSPQLWLVFFSGLSLLQAALWAGLFTLSIIDPRFETLSSYIALAIAGLAAGATYSLTPRRWLAVANVTILLSPAAFVSVFSSVHFTLLVLILLYIVYLTSLGKQSNREYLRSYDIELQLKQQQRELERVNQIDPLTQIYNRGYFNSALSVQWNNAIRLQQDIALLFIDIDHFKSINDQYGHLVGDESLSQVAAVIKQSVQRNNDIVARFGGEEFAVLLNDSSIGPAIELAEKIRSNIENTSFKTSGPVLKITISIGVSCLLPSDKINSNLLIDTADKSVYQAKRDGRNCVRSVDFNQPQEPK